MGCLREVALGQQHLQHGQDQLQHCQQQLRIDFGGRLAIVESSISEHAQKISSIEPRLAEIASITSLREYFDHRFASQRDGANGHAECLDWQLRSRSVIIYGLPVHSDPESTQQLTAALSDLLSAVDITVVSAERVGGGQPTGQHPDRRPPPVTLPALQHTAYTLRRDGIRICLTPAQQLTWASARPCIRGATGAWPQV